MTQSAWGVMTNLTSFACRPLPPPMLWSLGRGPYAWGSMWSPCCAFALTRREPVRSAGCVVVGCRDCEDLEPQVRQAPGRKCEEEKEPLNPARRVGVSSQRAGGLTPDQPGPQAPVPTFPLLFWPSSSEAPHTFLPGGYCTFAFCSLPWNALPVTSSRKPALLHPLELQRAGLSVTVMAVSLAQSPACRKCPKGIC